MSTAHFRAAFFAAVALMLAGSVSPAQAPEPSEKPDVLGRRQMEAAAGNYAEGRRQVIELRKAADELLPVLAARPAPGASSSVATDGSGGADAKPKRKKKADPPTVSLVGPKQVASGDMVIVAIGTVPKDATPRWYVKPDPGPEKRAVFSEPGSGRLLLIFLQPPEGEYLLALTAQRGDEFALDQSKVLVGRAPDPGPGPDPDPDPVPVPLKGLAKTVYDAARPINDPASAAKFAENYGAITSAIAAGAYAALPFQQAKAKIVADLFAANRPIVEENAAWAPVFNGPLRTAMNALEQGGQLGTLEAVAARLTDIETGFAEAAK